MKVPTVSVILPNYNYAKYFSSRLDEVLSQTYPISEIIILDDASTDASVSCINTKLAEIKGSFPNVKFETILNKKNSGSVFSQWQKGIKQATSDYLWIAELDDSASPHFLETVMASIIKDENIILSYTNSRLIGTVSAKDRLRTVYDLLRHRSSLKPYVIEGTTEVKNSLAIFNTIPNISACVIKNLPELAKILDSAKTFHLSGDWYFYLCLLGHGNLAYSPKRLNSHRLSKESVTSQTELKDRFEETRRIHAIANQIYDLPESTKKRMEKTEQRLRSSWSI